MTAQDAPRIRARALPLPVGTFHLDVPLGRWAMSGTAREILGLPRTRPVTTARLLELVPVEEVEACVGAVREALGAHAPFSTHLRPRTSPGREAVVVGEGEYDAQGGLVAVRGQVVDVRHVTAEHLNAELDAKVAEVVTNRATIEQAKGALCLAYGFDEDAAIALLRWWSSHRNVKVHTLAGQLMESSSAGAVTSPELRASVERVLDTDGQAS